MALCACNDDPEPAPRFQAIQQLYEMYGEKLIGELENDTLQNGDVTVYEYMKLDVDMQHNPYIAIDDTANTADRLFSFYGTDGNVMIIDTGYNTSLKRSRNRKTHGSVTF